MKKPSVCFVSIPIYHLLADSADSRYCGGAELQKLLIGRELTDWGYAALWFARMLRLESILSRAVGEILGSKAV